MKRYILPAALCLILNCCTSPLSEDPYSSTLCSLTVTAQYPDGYTYDPATAFVSVEDINTGSSYTLTCDAQSRAQFSLPEGLYRVRCSNICGDDIFNASVDNRKIEGDTELSLSLNHSVAGRIILKEIYCGGCMKYPEQGTYQTDKYVILHNNYPEVQYLDGLCFGTVSPYNSNSSNPFITNGALPSDFVPIIQAVWQFGGTGTDFPLQPGEDAVLCISGAIDHSAQYPLSVNLNRPGYFVCYNETYFTNTSYHPAPGDQIKTDHILEVVVKTGQANAYTFSVNSPAAVLFRAPEGTTMAEYVASEGAVVQQPGSNVDRVVKIPPVWIADAVEVFNGGSTTNTKRLLPSLDAGSVILSGTYLGHTLHRKTDTALSAGLGYEVLQDTNDSSSDFYERETQSLHE